MPFYSGGDFHTTFTADATRQSIVTGIETALSANGWTVVSGGGTGDVVLQSAAPAGGAALRLRVTDPGAGNCATLKIQQAGGGLESQAFYLLPGAGKVYSVWGCQYQAFIFTGGSATTSREYFGCGALYVPAWLQPSVTEALWASGNGLADASVNVGGCFRNSAAGVSMGTANTFLCARWSGILNGALLNRAADNSGNGATCDMTLAAAAAGLGMSSWGIYQARRFHDDTALMIDAWLAFGITGTTDEAKYRGAIWDAAVVSETFAGGAARSIDGHTFYAVGNNVSMSAAGKTATLFLL